MRLSQIKPNEKKFKRFQFARIQFKKGGKEAKMNENTRRELTS